mmetsp:Transcript_73/g.172  ORF Transcript_73/g.172 Transcript_73/m.172 type:complete len:271 (+) Transcript_73:74-886(+)
MTVPLEGGVEGTAASASQVTAAGASSGAHFPHASAGRAAGSGRGMACCSMWLLGPAAASAGASSWGSPSAWSLGSRTAHGGVAGLSAAALRRSGLLPRAFPRLAWAALESWAASESQAAETRVGADSTTSCAVRTTSSAAAQACSAAAHLLRRWSSSAPMVCSWPSACRSASPASSVAPEAAVVVSSAHAEACQPTSSQQSAMHLAAPSASACAVLAPASITSRRSETSSMDAELLAGDAPFAGEDGGLWRALRGLWRAGLSSGPSACDG